MRYIVLILLTLVGFGTYSLADSWIFPQKLTTQSYEFGLSRIVLEVDARTNQGYPDHILSVYVGDDMVAKYRNIGFEQIFASEDNQYFVGLSNHGIPGTAFVIFDAQGNLIREEKHRFLPGGIYSERSVTVMRKWFNSEKPEVEFKIENKLLTHVWVQGSDKVQGNEKARRFDLLKPDIGAHLDTDKSKSEG